MNALSYVNIDQGIHKGRSKVAQSEKGKNCQINWAQVIMQLSNRNYLSKTVFHLPWISQNWIKHLLYLFFVFIY